MTSLQKKEEKARKAIQMDLNENLFFDREQEIILTEQEVKMLEKNLTNMEIDENTSLFFKSAYKLYKKLEENDFIISLEEIERE